MPATLAELTVAQHKRELLLKPLEARVFIAAMGLAVPAAITSGAEAELAELPEGWYDVGLILKDDAISWTRAVESSDINAIGYRDPVRSDITSDVTGLAFTALESNRWSLERHIGQSLDDIVPTPVTGEVVIDQRVTKKIRNRYLAIARDENDFGPVYIGRCVTAGEVTDVGEQTWTDGEGSIAYPTTLNGMVDTNLTPPTSIRHYFGGAGWREFLEDAGFPALAS